MRRGPRPEAGSALLPVLILVILSMVLVGAHFSASMAASKHVELLVAETEAFNAAESGLNAAIARVWATFRRTPFADRVDALAPIDGHDDPEDQLVISGRTFGTGSWSVEVIDVVTSGVDYADVAFRARGRNAQATRTLSCVVRFGHAPSRVFDYVYFINNFGWLWGSTITVNGDVRSNGDFSMRNAYVNGDIYAASNDELGSSGSIEGDSRVRDLDWYHQHAGDQARPTNPTATPEDANGNGVLDAGEDRNGNGVLDDFPCELGFDGESERFANQQPVEMPYLGSLDTYEALAIREGGTIVQDGAVVVRGVLGDDAGEDENLILIGTKQHPIEINGPVVIRNDIVLRGVITGQGSIYAGRNVHILGSLEYDDPPEWPKPSEDPDGDREANKTKDLVGLVARGSVILGDYTQEKWQHYTDYYQSPPFTQSYVVDPADADIGYVTDTDPQGRPVFDGDYTAEDGGTKTDGSARRFFESSFPDDLIRQKSAGLVTQVDAIIYTNHILTGHIGACTFNGSIISRDEAILYQSRIEMNYDIRTRPWGRAFLEIFLPRAPNFTPLFWSEGE